MGGRTRKTVRRLYGGARAISARGRGSDYSAFGICVEWGHQRGAHSLRVRRGAIVVVCGVFLGLGYLSGPADSNREAAASAGPPSGWADPGAGTDQFHHGRDTAGSAASRFAGYLPPGHADFCGLGDSPANPGNSGGVPGNGHRRWRETVSDSALHREVAPVQRFPAGTGNRCDWLQPEHFRRIPDRHEPGIPGPKRGSHHPPGRYRGYGRCLP